MMRLGGKWSWKWAIVNAGAWLAAITAVIGIGFAVELPAFLMLKNFKWVTFIGTIALSAVLAPTTFVLVHLRRTFIQRYIQKIAEEQTPTTSTQAKLIHDEKRLQESLTRIVRDAGVLLYATGSRSRIKAYLDLIEERVKNNADLSYTRILFGPIRTKELEVHCREMFSLTATKRVKIVTIDDSSRHTEVFFTANEHESILVISSLNAIGKFDCGLHLKGKLHLKALLVLENYSRAASPWTLPNTKS